MSDTENGGCATIIEVLIPGPQGPGGTGSSGMGGYPVSVEDVEEGHIIVFDGEVWENRPQTITGDMKKAIYDTDNDGKVDAAKLADSVAWTGVADKPSAFPPLMHSHTIQEVTGLAEELAVKVDAADVMAALTEKAPLISPVFTGTPAAPTPTPGTDNDQIATTAFVKGAVDGIAVPTEVTWGDVTNKPETFPPAVHSHSIANVSGLTETLDAKANAVAVAAALADKADADAVTLALAGKADLAAIPIVPAIAGVATVRAGTDDGQTLGVKDTLDAHAPVVLTDAASIAVDLAQGIVFTVTLEDNRSLANPENQIAGRNGLIIVKQDETGSHTLSFGAHWRFVGSIPELSTLPGAVDIIAWYVEAAGTIRAAFLKGS